MRERERHSGKAETLILTVLALFAPLCNARGATVTVTGTGDTVAVDGSVTLREAITSINAGANVNADVVAVGAYGTNDTVAFNITGGCAAPCTIAIVGVFPALSKPMTIDGYTQPGASANTLAVGDNAVLKIEIDANGDTGISVLFVNGGNTTFRGLNLHSVGSAAIWLNFQLSNDNVVEGCFIGTNPAGTAAAANNGVAINFGGDNNRVGGTSPAQRNVISGNAQGIKIATGANTVIQGNYIGTNASGNAAIGNGLSGITGVGAIGALTIGGTVPGAGNVISGSVNQSGILFAQGPIGFVTIQGNIIGADVTGVNPLGNHLEGIDFLGSGSGSAGALVGGTVPGAGNVIAFNGTLGNGTSGIFVGGDPGNEYVGVAIQGNSIHDNVGRGIFLAGSGAIPSIDACDADTGNNNLQNFPVIASASIGSGNVTISGTLNSTANTTFRVEFFSNVVCDPDTSGGFGEGRTFLGFANVTTDGTCNASFGPLVLAIPGGETIITATATDPANNTSEFSACLSATGAPTTPTPTLTPTPTPAGVPVTPTPTPPGGPAANVPTLSGGMLALFCVCLAALALLLLRRL